MRFKRIYVEITNICNLNCSFCSKDKRLKREMSVLEFEKVISKIKDYTDCIYLHVKGEALLHSSLDQILDVCDKNNIRVRITTNGTLLEEKLDILKKHNINQINISLHCENNKKDYFSSIFKCIDELNINVVYRIWTLDNLKLDEKSTKIVDEIKKYYNLSTKDVDNIINSKNVKIKDNIYLDKDYEFKWPIINEKQNDSGTCYGTRSHIGILSNGDIIPCCLDSNAVIKLGNIFNNNLEDVINSTLFCEINNGFKNNKINHSLCRSCTYRCRFDSKNEK